MSDLRIDMDNELGGAQTEGAFRALCRMQVTFKRKKGEYFAHYAFGTSTAGGAAPESRSAASDPGL